MKRLYVITLEYGRRAQVVEYKVVATTDEEAVKRAKRKARLDYGLRAGWRTTSLIEKPEEVIA